MLSISNGLSLLRAPLAFLFLIENVPLRIIAIVLAMLTDGLDGYLARRYRATTQFGAVLDPVMDKFFVFFALGILLKEGQLQGWEAAAMLSRDFSLCIFGIYLGLAGRWHDYRCKAIRWGKVTTAFQFLVLITLTLHYLVPWYIYPLFVLSGMLAFIELCQIVPKQLEK